MATALQFLRMFMATLVGVTLTPDVQQNALFDRSAGPGDWVSGDGAYPVHLPDGRVAWLMGDSTVKDSLGKPRFVHNCIVVESADGKSLATVVGPGATDLVPPITVNTVLWPGSGFVENNRLLVFFEEIELLAGGGFHSSGRRFLVALNLPGLKTIDMVSTFSGQISWGHAVLVRGGYVYAYGNREIDGWTNITYLARFPLGSSQGRSAWRFWNANELSFGGLLNATPLRGPDGNQLVAKIASVVPYGSFPTRFAVFTIDPFGKTVDLRLGGRPWGPFGSKQSIYDIPEDSTYLPHAHWEAGGHLQIAYSVPNARPRFIRS